MVLGLHHGISEDPRGDVGSLSKREDEGRNKRNNEPDTLQTRSTYEQVEHVKAESAQRDAELDSKLEKAKAEMEELKASLVQKEAELCNVKEENKVLNTKINEFREGKSKAVLELEEFSFHLGEINTLLSVKEMDLDDAIEEIKLLRVEIEEACQEAMAMAEAARAAGQEALLKPGHLSEEADKSSGRVERLTEQLDKAQAANTELEAKLSRSKVPSDQLRKAAVEVGIFSRGNNGKFMERTRSLDRAYNPVTDSPKKKKGNMWKRIGASKKIGVLWEKGQKYCQVPDMIGGNHGTMHVG